MTIKRKFLTLAIVIGCLGTGAVASLTYHQAQQQLNQKLIANVDQLGNKIDVQLKRYSRLPQVLANDPRLLGPLLSDVSERYPVTNQFQVTSQMLQEWCNTLGADTIYLMDPNGTTLASSNWQAKQSFVGQNYHYRPYFQQAFQGQHGQYFALGVSSEKRGYFFSAPVRYENTVQGVLTIKVDLSLIQDIWQYEEIEYAITDARGIVFYSSEPTWLYHSLAALSPEVRQQVIASRQYGNAPLAPLTHSSTLAEFNQLSYPVMSAPGSGKQTRFSFARHEMAKAGWTIYGFTPLTAVSQMVGQELLIFILLYILLCFALHAWWQTYRARRDLAKLNSKLERTVTKRTQNLQNANQQLKQTLRQYELSQAELKQTQSELMQAAKLAMLGELSASINHEINQPLAAMRTYAENSRKLLAKERFEAVAGNLDEIVRLNGLVADIIARFKVFARKTSPQAATRHTNVHESVRAAAALLRTSLIKQGVVLRIGELNADTTADIDAVQFEQVLVNLLQNSVQALAEHPEPQIGVDFTCHQNTLSCHVWDNGPGLSDQQKQSVFNPFYTTKPDGLGLGLTISQRILHASQGELSVTDHPGGGAEFIITLPLSSERSS